MSNQPKQHKKECPCLGLKEIDCPACTCPKPPKEPQKCCEKCYFTELRKFVRVPCLYCPCHKKEEVKDPCPCECSCEGEKLCPYHAKLKFKEEWSEQELVVFLEELVESQKNQDTKGSQKAFEKIK